jgi:hypothetical protein
MVVDEFGREVPGGRHEDDYYERRGPHHHHRHRPSTASPRHISPERRKTNVHPSLEYAKEPLLCEYLWKEKNNPTDETAYEAYRRSYCLNYIRAFFNKHLDDTWFRSRYSPLGRQRFAVLERNRSVEEARALWQQMVKDEASFLTGAKLGGGVKSSNISAPPVSHLFSWQQPGSTETALLVSDIPSVVTDEQLVIAILNHCTLPDLKQPNLVIYAGSFIPTAGVSVLQRQAVVVGQAPVIQDIWTTLCKSSSSRKDRSVPRKEDDDQNDIMNLEVDSSDPYGRLEYDDDGRGGAPPNGSTVPIKKSIVAVQRLRTGSATTSVLTAALSSTTRCATDQAAALRLAQSLDCKRHIPTDCGIDAVLGKLFGDKPNDDRVEDVLDVCIAYLRRIHLVSFYNGCDQPAKAVVDTLTGRHPSSTIHLRLQDADATLKRAADEAKNSENNGEAVKDLLVQRLDDSIQRALEECERVDGLVSTVAGDEQVSLELGLAPEVIQDASEIVSAEDQVRDKWLHDHSVLDDDQRARCSFHFCHKLFKDTSFLHKHLLKKHVEYLSAEQAKVHDEYMMKAWEAASERPVPDVLVDCGSRFGFVAASVIGQVPDCVDPEPGLWKREEERQEKEKQEREMMMRSRRDEVRHHHNYVPREAEPIRRSQFVDVDDMKVEKVEMSFENVEVPTAAAQKKKKKRKLL